jgi:protein ImuB
MLTDGSSSRMRWKDARSKAGHTDELPRRHLRDIFGIRFFFGPRLPFPMALSRTSLCLWLPAFELRLELARSPELDTTSVALLAPAEPGGRQVVDQVSERAGASGVRAGMLVSQAVSLCPGLTLLEPDPAHYHAAFGEVVEALESITPILEPREPGLVHLGVDGLHRILGSPEGEVRQVLGTLLEVLPPPLVAALRVGRAPGTFGAWVAAAAARPGAPVLLSRGDPAALPRFLAPQPVGALPLDAGELELLERLDIRTLGRVAALPETALVRHFGHRGREIRRLARGERVDPVRPLHRPRPLRVSLDFPAPVGDRAALHRALDRLLDRLLAHPERRDRAIRKLRGGGYVEGGGSWEVGCTPREPAARRAPLAFALRTRMELAPPPRALDSLFVEATDFGAPATQISLFDRREAGAREEANPLAAAGGRAGQAGGRVGQAGGRAGRAGGGADDASRSLPPALQAAVRELRLRLGANPLYRVVEVDPWSRIPERRHALLPLEG